MNSLLQRVLTGTLMAVIGALAVWWHAWSFYALTLLLNAFLLQELYRLLRNTTGYSDSNWWKIVALRQVIGGYGVLVTALVLEHHLPPIFFLSFLLVFPIFLIAELFLKARNEIVNFSINMAGLVYITVPMVSMLVIARTDDHYAPAWVLGLMSLVVANDVFAYFTGSLLGRTKLLERISPKKTWEGAIGGAAFTLLTGWLVHEVTGLRDVTDWLVLAAIAVVFGTLGDLVESMIKRNLQIKDSGKMLPGHGGFLDRFDAILLALPFFALYILFTQ